MKSVRLNSLVTRLATLTAVMLFSQQAMAVGTDAGVTVTNTATVDYSVGAVPQAQIASAAVSFVVDRRVDFTLVADPDPVVATTVMVGVNDNAVAFTLTNTGNATQDFAFLSTNEVDGTDVLGLIDSGDMNNLRVIADNNDNGTPDDAENFIDELPEDGIRTVWILGDTDTPIPNQLLNGDIAHVLLTATAHDAGAAGLGGVSTQSAADDPDTEDTVLGVGGTAGNGVATAQNTYQVESAALTITKDRTIISDPIGSPTGPYYIPGAVVEYLITVVNTSTTTDAVNVSVSDVLTDVTLVTDPYGTGDDVEILNDGASIDPCVADDGDGDTDGCELDAGTNTLIVGNGNLAITVVADTTMTVRFQVTIN